jgi:uncharacterized protein (TIRG00374 family)
MAAIAQLGSKACWLFRWKELLDSAGARRSVTELTRLVLSGLFFNNFLPSSVGGDVARGVGLAALGVPRATAAASVLADRIIGVFSLALTAVAGAAIGAVLFPGRGPWIAAGLVALVLAGIIRASFDSRVLARVGRSAALSGERGSTSRSIRRVLDAGRFLAERGGTLRRAFALSLGLSVFSTIYHWAIGRSLDLPVPFAVYCVLVPAVMMFAAIPITLNGLGIREAGFVELLVAQGVSREEATVFAFLAFLGTLGFALAGGILFIAERRRPPVREGVT